MFVAGEAPQKEELDKVFKAINNEVAYAQVDKVLHDTVIKNVAKTVKLMCAKCEHLIDCSASQVVGYPTNEQRRNVEVVNCLFSFYVGIESILGGSNNDYSSKDIEKLIKSAIEPLIQSVVDAVEAILITMHNENFNLDTAYNYSFSPYMRELNDFIAKIHGNFLSKFDCKTLVAESTFPLGQRTIDLFILHASIVRPVSANGQIKLFQDSISKGIKFQIFLWAPSRCPKEAHKTTQRASRLPLWRFKMPQDEPKTFPRCSLDAPKTTPKFDQSRLGRRL